MLEAEELEDLAETASTLVDLAKQQRHDCDELLRKLEAAVNAFESRTTELIRDMPKQIAQRAAEIVVRDIADLVAHKVAKVLQPAEAKVQTLLKEMKDEVVECRRAATEYRHARWNAVLTCIIASGFGVLVILVIWAFWRSSY